MSFMIDIGDVTEDEVQRSVERAFSPLFVYRAPRKDTDQKEVTDVLVPWDDVALIIQVKAQAASVASDNAAEPLRWARKNLAKAGRQVAGAVRAIRGGRMTYMENPLRGRVAFPGDEIKWLYGVVVLHHHSPPYDPFQLVPELQATTVPLHILSFRDFANLVHFLDTPADLINYLEERSSVLLPTLRPQVHAEQEVFSYWLENLEKLMAFRAEKRGEVFTEEDARPYAERLRLLMSGQHPEAGAGGVIDHMIEQVPEPDPNLGSLRSGGDVIEMSPAASVKVATELGKITRVRRIALGRRYLRTVQIAAKENRDAWKSTHSQERSDCMLFLASPLPKERRKERQEHLLVLTEVLKHYYQVQRGLGIATEAGVDSGRSYDFVYLEGEPTENEEVTRLGEELFGKTVGRLSDEPQ